MQILASRTEKRSVGGKAGNSFSVATFAAREELPAGTDDHQYWESLMPEAVQVWLRGHAHYRYILFHSNLRYQHGK